MAERKVFFLEVDGDVTAPQLKLLTTLFSTVLSKRDGRVFVGGTALSPTEIAQIMKDSENDAGV